MDRRPIITYAGDPALFTGLQGALVAGLPQEAIEWRRSFGRPTRSVNIEVDFVPFMIDCLSSEIPRTILGRPIFHTYWTDCIDVDTYKSSVKEKIQTWITNLKHSCVVDWMVILVETPDAKKSNKLLPRTTVLDKMKNDLGSKQGERCISLIDPQKSDSRSIESWQGLLIKMRHLLMIAYNRALNKFEDNMRAERERRIEKSWSFCDYFLLQEELARVFSSLQLHDEALVQYDELDALFTQFVLNSAAGDTPSWLNTFSGSCQKWEGLHISEAHNFRTQDKIRKKEASLLEFRNYLFQCQCSLLLLLNKPWELASRAFTFLQNVAGELKILEVNIADGGEACWGFLSCLEVINILGKYKEEPSTADAHALHTAPLWAYARDKLQELGRLCGLVPGSGEDSSHLHIVVSLVCGMGSDPRADEFEHSDNPKHTPMTQLKDALSSQESFRNHFLEFSEVAISTYKHIGRIRSARLICKDLASFYIKVGEPQKAIGFLVDQLKMFLDEGWPLLTAQTQLELSKCYLATKDMEKYIKTCAQLAANSVLSEEERHKAFQHMMDAVEDINQEEGVLISTDRIFEVNDLKIISKGEVILDSEVQIQIQINSLLPAGVRCAKVALMLDYIPETPSKPASRSGKKPAELEHKLSSSSNTSRNKGQTARRTTSDAEEKSPLKEDQDTETEAPGCPSNRRLKMSVGLEYKQDDSLSTASVLCADPHKILRRRDSENVLRGNDISVLKETKEDFLSIENIIIKSGVNHITLTTKVTKKGSYTAGQLILKMDKLEFVCNRNQMYCPPLSLEVISENPRVFLGRKDRDLVAGLLQPMLLTIHSGSTTIVNGTTVKLKTSRGLLAKLEDDDSELSRDFEIPLPGILPFSTGSVALTVLAELGPQRDPSTVEHIVSLTSVLIEQRLDIEVHFLPPFMSSHKLHTANMRKFMQVNVVGLVPTGIQLSNPSLKIQDDEMRNIQLKMLNRSHEELIVCSDQSASYMWELEENSNDPIPTPIKTEFMIDYCPKNPFDASSSTNSNDIRKYRCTFDLQDYKTLYTIKARVEPNKGSEFIRAGNMCHFHASLHRVEQLTSQEIEDTQDEDPAQPKTDESSVMYEVLADQNAWAVCGRTSGVLTLDYGSKKSVTLDVMPLVAGFLPLPSVRLSKYVPADTKHHSKSDGSKKSEIVGSASSVPRLEPFSTGQVYNFGKALQVHVLPVTNSEKAETT